MHQHCHRCGLDLPISADLTTFCPHCGAPQLYLQEYDRAPEADPNAPSDSTGTPPPPHPGQLLPRVIDWQTAIRCAALVAAIAELLNVIALPVPPMSVISNLWVLTASMTTLALYQRRRPLATMDARVGARIGLATGLALIACVTFALAVAGVVARFALHSTASFDATITQLLQQMTVQLTHAAEANPDLPAVLRFVASPEFRAGYILLSVAIGATVVLFVSTLGGAVGGLLRTRRRATS
jgi:hypothetical protein